MAAALQRLGNFNLSEKEPILRWATKKKNIFIIRLRLLGAAHTRENIQPSSIKHFIYAFIFLCVCVYTYSCCCVPRKFYGFCMYTSYISMNICIVSQLDDMPDGRGATLRTIIRFCHHHKILANHRIVCVCVCEKKAILCDELGGIEYKKQCCIYTSLLNIRAPL